MALFRQGMEVGNESEDCLVLNIFTPDASPIRKRPVMVWLHRGGFIIGSSADPIYDGSRLARRGDVVVVTLNHRLNAFGYLYLGDLNSDFADSGNAGQLDQILALRWIRDNIANFGGDPGNVTIFGHAGGGEKVSTLMAMPPAAGLFHKAVIQSGPGLMMCERDKATALSEALLAELQIPKDHVHRLCRMKRRALLQAASAVVAKLRERRALSPVVDGRSLPGHPFTPAATEMSRNIPLLIGTTKDEATLSLVADPNFHDMTIEQARLRFRALGGAKAERAFDLYRSVLGGEPPIYWVSSMMTDQGVWADSIRLVERKLAQGGAPVYMYRFEWETPILNAAMRSAHGLDVAMVFDTVDVRRQVYGPGDEPERLADVMCQAWINFAWTGDPSQSGLIWPAYELRTRKTMIFDAHSRVVSDPSRENRELWTT